MQDIHKESEQRGGDTMQAPLDIYHFSFESIDGELISLARYRGKSLLIVNTASKCGFTPQYQDLEAVYRQYKSSGFEILAFPCNQFGSQEPGSNDEIADFCKANFDTSFQIAAKVKVNGADAHPLYKHLCTALPGLMGSRAIKWNFTKFFINKDGKPVKRFAPNDKPHDIMTEMAPHL